MKTLHLSALLCAVLLSACQSAPQSSNKPVAHADRPAPVKYNVKNVIIGADVTMGRALAKEYVTGAQLYYATTSPAMVAPSAEKYDKITDNSINVVGEKSVSTFALDVDTSSYANTRRFLAQGQMPPPDAVRVEELLNYFPSQGGSAKRMDNAPFAVDYELSTSPWHRDKALLRVNVQAVGVNERSAPPAHLTFLVDVSGSMHSPDKLPLVQKSLKMLVHKLRPQDTVSLVTYAGATAVVLQPTSGKDKLKIEQAIDALTAGGGTAGGAGLKLAYDMARQNFVKGDINRILLATDGDFNVGVSSTEELKAMVKRERDKGITLSTLGFGTGNYNDAMMEQIADVGNGNSSYIDSLREAEKVLGDEMGATLVTVAKDVKAQLEFNPTRVQEWRQIGYENRQLKREDFNNDAVDAGDIGAGKRVTVLYELTLTGSKPSVDPLRYQPDGGIPVPPEVDARMDELAFLKMRWKAPEDSTSALASLPIVAPARLTAFSNSSSENQFMGAVAAFGQKLRNNPATQNTPWSDIAQWARTGKGADDAGYRAEFVNLVKDAQRLN
ncbi:MAG: vWA domain-containing protein [Formosimonas sp.]